MGDELAQLHHRFRDSGDEYLAVELAVLRGERPPGRARNWVDNLHLVETYRKTIGTMPVNRPGDRASTSLAEYLRYNRRLWRRGELTEYQLERLELAGWSCDPRGTAWDDGLLGCSAFLDVGTVPRRGAEDPAERRAAAWLDWHRRELRAGRMPHERRAEFLQLEGRREGVLARRRSDPT